MPICCECSTLDFVQFAQHGAYWRVRKTCMQGRCERVRCKLHPFSRKALDVGSWVFGMPLIWQVHTMCVFCNIQSTSSPHDHLTIPPSPCSSVFWHRLSNASSCSYGVNDFQENWFNYGAASEKWIPPERRLHARSEYRDMEGKRDVPFHWNPTQGPARVCSVCMARLC